MPSKILKCKCAHEAQDKLYGPHMRVFNARESKRPDEREYTCTVCNSVILVKGSTKSK